MRYKTNTKVYNLRKEGLAKLRYVLENIRDGNLEHNQDSFHCGTAHCVYGWVELLEHASVMPLEKLIELDFYDGNYILNYDTNETIATLKNNKKIKFNLDFNTVTSWIKKYKIDSEKADEHITRIYSGEARLTTQFKALAQLEIMYLGEIQTLDYDPFGTTEVQQKNYNEMMKTFQIYSPCETMYTTPQKEAEVEVPEFESALV